MVLTSAISHQTWFDLPFELVRSAKRKTLTIEVSKKNVRVRIPAHFSDQKTYRLLEPHLDWVQQKWADQAKVVETSPKAYHDGETFYFLGKPVHLTYLNDQPLGYVHLAYPHLYVGTNKVGSRSRDSIQLLLRKVLDAWYRTSALSCLRDKTEHFEKLIGVKPSTVNVRKYKARWGSCSSSGAITYNFCIIMAPHDIVNYIVVHELCHLIEYNHSPRFWKLVGRFISSPIQCRQWLRYHGARLTLD